MTSAHMRSRHLVILALACFAVSSGRSAGEPGFIPIFDGSTLNGWSSPDMSFWTVEQGAITGRSTKEKPATDTHFLLWQGGEVQDFELQLKFRILGVLAANSGIQFRSIFNAEATRAQGYQADIGRSPVYLGNLVDEGLARGNLAERGSTTVLAVNGTRKSTQVGDSAALFKSFNLDGWNDCRVIARGNHLKYIINGQVVSEVIDGDNANAHVSGTLGLQLHAVALNDPAFQVQFEHIILKKYPSATESVSGSESDEDTEDSKNGDALREFRVEPAAETFELTPANGYPREEAFLQWHRSHGDATNSSFSLLDQINRKSVKQLQVAWIYHSRDGKGNIECNPVIVDGVMYAPTPGGHIVALNAETGKEIWRFQAGGASPALRGLVYWEGDRHHPSRILFNAGRYLFALDPKTGKCIAEFGSGGKVETGRVSVAGAIYRNVFVVPGADKDAFGYDLFSGKHLWTFHTVPVPGEYGYETWSKSEGGADCWGGMAMDEQRGIAYIATSSPHPDFAGPGHLGRNLFANSIIAIDALTGKRIWHFQEIRHDIWDLDIPAPPNLVTITRDGKKIDAVAQLTKLGNTLLLDRLTGKPIFPFRLRRAPESKLTGERAWPYQPDVERPEPLSPQEFTLDDVTDRSSEAHRYVMQQLAHANLGWFAPPEEGRPTPLYGLQGGAEWTGGSFDPTTGFLYVNVNKQPWMTTMYRDDEGSRDPNLPPTAGEKIYGDSCSACHGGRGEGGGIAPPLLGLRHRLTDNDVIQTITNGRGVMPPITSLTNTQKKDLLDFLFHRDRPGEAEQQASFNGYLIRLLDQEGYPGCKPPWGTLVCLNLNTGKIVWKAVLGEYQELTVQGIPKTGTPNLGGTLVTAGGLVFCAGTRDNKIRAFDKDSGEELWLHDLPWGGYAPPATYQVHGVQFVVIAATGGGFPGRGMLAGPQETGDAYVAFAIRNNTANLPSHGVDPTSVNASEVGSHK